MWTTRGTAYSAGTPADTFTVFRPTRWRGDGTKPGVILLHGATKTDATNFLASGSPNMAAIVRAIVAAGYPCVAPNVGGDTYGNDLSNTLITDASAHLTTIGAKAGKRVLFGGSMGAGAAMVWARANPALVSCIVGLIPLSDLTDIHTNNRMGTQAAINAAYGGAYSEATYGATKNPATFGAQLAAIPHLLAYATDDTTVLPATVTALAGLIGASATLATLTGGHTDAALAGISPATVVAFLDAHAIPPPSSALVADAFSRADETPLSTAETGQTWAVFAGTGLSVISGECGNATGGTQGSVVDAGTTDATVTYTQAENPAVSTGDRLLLRVTDTNNYLFLRMRDGHLRQRVAGVETVRGILPEPPNPNDVLDVTLSGADVTVSRNGVEELVTTTAVLTGTSYGFQLQDTDTRVDDFEVTA